MKLYRTVLSTLLPAITIAPIAFADADKGKAVFAQCAACHMVGEGAQNRFGPALNNIVGQPASSIAGYDYSASFKQFLNDGLVWSEEELDAFLKAPMSYAAGTKMAYPGLPSEEDRANVIAYLATFTKPETSVEETVVSEAPETTSNEPRPLARDAVVPAHGVFHLGRPAMAEEVAAWDIDVRPDGLGLPDGSGDALTGADLYDAQCAMCHGVFGEGEGRWPILAGGHDTLTEERPEKTIGSYWPYLSTVYDYVNRAMPFGNARSLSPDDVYAITAYLLYLNDLVDEDFVLSKDNFASVRLPNEENFFFDDRADEEGYVLSGEPCMSNCIEGQAKVVQRARVLDVTPDGE